MSQNNKGTPKGTQTIGTQAGTKTMGTQTTGPKTMGAQTGTKAGPPVGPQTGSDVPSPEKVTLFPDPIIKSPLPFVPFISSIIAITLFIYGMIQSSDSDSENPSATIGIKQLLILYITGFVLIFFNAFINSYDSKWWEDKKREINSKSSGIAKILANIQMLLSTCIAKINGNVPFIGRVEYFNFPFNYVIFTAILIAICFTLLANAISLEVDYGADNVSLGKWDVYYTMKKKSVYDFDLLKYGLGICGILFAIFTNWLVMKALDPDTSENYSGIINPEKTMAIGGKISPSMSWKLRIIRWIIGFFSFIIMGHHLTKWSIS